MTNSGRVMAFDLGDKRIGVAVSDPFRMVAHGRPTVERSGESVPWKAILGAIEADEVAQLVVGDPLHLDGSSGERSRISREFATELERRTGLPVELQDERLSTVTVERAMRETTTKRRRREARGKGEIDQAAAVVILQTWLDRQAAKGLPS